MNSCKKLRLRDVSIEDISMPNNTLSKRCHNRTEPDKGMPSINTVVLIASNFMNANNIVKVNIKRANTRDMSYVAKLHRKKDARS